MRLRFWGVRGSIACPGPETVHFGGNTPCLELFFEEVGRRIIIDAGSGIRMLGNRLLKQSRPQGAINADLFITHTHWDHIMGFPFFEPIFRETTSLKIYGPVTYEDDSLETIIGDQLRYRYFPIRHNELKASIQYRELKECQLDLGDGITVKTKYLNHPVLCFGYRFEYKDKIFCTAYDTEPFRNVFQTNPSDAHYDASISHEGERAAQQENDKLLDFFKGGDVIIHDAQYIAEEYNRSKTGWGHACFEDAIDFAHKAGIKKLFFFHHDPLRTDRELFALEKHYQGTLAKGSSLECAVAREGIELVI